MQKGFSLIEISVVLVIISILLGVMLEFSSSNIDAADYEATEKKIAAIQDAITVFMKSNPNRNLPCPAARDTAENNASFGLASACTVAAGAGLTDVGTIRIGVVPTKTLGLPDSMMIDGFGNRILYAVTKPLSTAVAPLDPLVNFGGITIKDGSTNDIVTNAAYVIVSHGKNAMGSNTRAGTAHASTCTGTKADQENCDNDDIIFRDTFSNDATTDSFFDDIVGWMRYDRAHYLAQ